MTLPSVFALTALFFMASLYITGNRQVFIRDLKRLAGFITFIGVLLTGLSLFIVVDGGLRMSGEILVKHRGWPHAFFDGYQGLVIAGPFKLYIIADILFYAAICFLVLTMIERLRAKK